MTAAGDVHHVRVTRPASADPTSGDWRWARGSAVGLTATLLALTGHAFGGGGRPPAAQLVVLGLVAVLGSVGLSGRRWTLGPLLGVLLGAQAAFHVAFGHEVAATPMTWAGHGHGQVGHPALSAHPVTTGMAAGHLLAALLTALVLCRGEAWCWRVAELLSRPVRAVRAFADPLIPPAGLPGPRDDVPLLWTRLVVRIAPLRGPPVAVPR